MILVDSSVWIDFFNGKATLATDFLRPRLGMEPFAIGDLMLVESLQGFLYDKDFRKALQLLSEFPVLTIGGKTLAVQAAGHYRALRKKGITVRGAIDMLIGTYCLSHSLPLLYSDKDFDPMVRHLGLQSAMGTLH